MVLYRLKVQVFVNQFSDTMKVLVFKTNIVTDQHIAKVRAVLDQLKVVSEWSVDTEDIDNVLRIIPSQEIKEHEIMYKIGKAGFICETLKY